MVSLAVNGKQPGDEITFPNPGVHSVRVRASVSGQVPLDRFDIVVNGQPVISRLLQRQTSVSIEEAIPLRGSAWIAARASGPGHRLILNDTHAFAHTSPVYVQIGKQRIAQRGDVRFWIEWIEKLIARAQERGRFATPEHKKEVIDVFERGLGVYRGLLPGS